MKTILISILFFGMVSCNNEYELTKIVGFPEEMNGCSCYFSENKDDFEKQKYIYLDTYYKGTAYISINGELIKVNLDNSEKNEVEVKVQFDTDEQNGSETWWKTGTITIIFKDGKVLKSEFIGECGC